MVIQFCKFLNSVSTCRSWLCPLLHSGLDSDRFLSELPYNLVICHSDNPFGLRTKSVQQCVAWKNDQTSDIHNTKQSRVVQKYVKHHSMRYCVRWVRYAVNSNVINHQAAAVIRKKNAQKYWEKTFETVQELYLQMFSWFQFQHLLASLRYHKREVVPSALTTCN